MTEEQIHKAVVQHLIAHQAKGVVWFHVPNGGKRHISEAVRFKTLGVRPGVSDILAIHNGEMFALELKKDGGRPTEHQLQFLSDFRNAGGHGVVAEGLDEALCCLKAWGLLR